MSVVYVFVHFLPELAESQQRVAEAAEGLTPAERHVFLIALAGLLTFYGLHRLAQASRSARAGGEVQGGRAGEEDAGTEAGVFRIHMASFAAYNLLVGYLLLHCEDMTTRGSCSSRSPWRFTSW